jgi:hypothetical protein
MSDVNTGPGAPQIEKNGATDTVTAETPEGAPGAQPEGNTDNFTESGEGDTFPRSYVEELRKESGGHRTKAKAAEDRADKLARQLHTALVTATNRLENPADLPYDAKHLEDSGELDAALDALLADRPYFAKRVVQGDAGQGSRGGHVEPFSLLSRLKGGN